MKTQRKPIGCNAARQSGFSMLEVLFVVGLLGLVSAVILPRFTNTSDGARQNLCNHNRRTLNAMIELYYHDQDAYPANINQLESPGYFPEGIPRCPVNESKYHIDNTTHRIKVFGGGGGGGCTAGCN